jgi:hypothetical protein
LYALSCIMILKCLIHYSITMSAPPPVCVPGVSSIPFWVVELCSLLEIYGFCGRMYCFRIHSSTLMIDLVISSIFVSTSQTSHVYSSLWLPWELQTSCL